MGGERLEISGLRGITGVEKLIANHQLLYIVSIIIYCKYRFG